MTEEHLANTIQRLVLQTTAHPSSQQFAEQLTHALLTDSFAKGQLRRLLCDHEEE